MKIGCAYALLASSTLLLLAAGCAKQTPPPAPAPPPPPSATSFLKPVASLLEIMEGIVEPSSKYVWESVGSESTPKGVVEKLPRTDADWKAVRLHALELAEAANLMVLDGRVVAQEGEKLRDPPGAGDYTPERAQQEIAANRETFAAYARALQDSAMAVVASTEKRDVDGLTEAGGNIDEACEQCHKRFWYPDAAAAAAEPPQATPESEKSAAPAAPK